MVKFGVEAGVVQTDSWWQSLVLADPRSVSPRLVTMAVETLVKPKDRCPMEWAALRRWFGPKRSKSLLSCPLLPTAIVAPFGYPLKSLAHPDTNRPLAASAPYLHLEVNGQSFPRRGVLSGFFGTDAVRVLDTYFPARSGYAQTAANCQEQLSIRVWK